MTENSDNAIIRDCLSGNPAAYAGLVDKYQKVIFNTALRLVNDKDEAKDITQEVFIRAYENLRINGKFSTDQQFKMKDTEKEFHLEYVHENDWSLFEYHLVRAEHSGRQRQPGEPTGTILEYNNPFEDQSLSFLMSTPESTGIKNLVLELDNYRTVELIDEMPANAHFKYSGGDKAFLYDQNWVIIKEIPVESGG